MIFVMWLIYFGFCLLILKHASTSCHNYAYVFSLKFLNSKYSIAKYSFVDIAVYAKNSLNLINEIEL